MKQVMIVGGPAHGAWLGWVGPFVRYPAEAEHWPDLRTARAVKMIAPGWRIQLTFYMDESVFWDRGRPMPERGLAMPGWVQGERLERSPLS